MKEYSEFKCIWTNIFMDFNFKLIVILNLPYFDFHIIKISTTIFPWHQTAIRH